MKFNHYIGTLLHIWDSPYPTEAQEFFLNNPETSVLFASGSYRGGKSVAGCMALIRHCLSFEGASGAIFRRNLTALKASTLLTLLGLLDPSWVTNLDNTSLTITLYNGSVIRCFGAEDADKLGSVELSASFVDEITEIDEEVFGQILGRHSMKLWYPSYYDSLPEDWQDYIEDLVDPDSDPHDPNFIKQTFVSCNPKSKSHWVYNSLVSDENRMPNSKAILTNSVDNLNLPESYIVRLISGFVRDSKKHTTDVIKQWVKDIRGGHMKASDLFSFLNVFGQRNVLGQWVSSEGAIFSFDPTKHVITPEEVEAWPLEDGEVPPTDKNFYDGMYIGIDFGFHNPRINVIGVKHNEQDQPEFTVVDYWSEKDMTPDQHAEAILAMAVKWDVSAVYCPPDQPGIIRQLRTHLDGITLVRKANNRVLAGINATATALNTGRLRFIDNGTEAFRLCVKEMEGYEWKSNKDGTKLDEPLKEDDHYCDSIRYLIHTYSLTPHFQGYTNK